MKLAEVRPLIDKLVQEVQTSGLAPGQGTRRHATLDAEIRLALESAFVAGVRSGLKFTSNAKFAEVFGGKTKPPGDTRSRKDIPYGERPPCRECAGQCLGFDCPERDL
jgi:hypothetical protein